jgi:hypothetical protein
MNLKKKFLLLRVIFCSPESGSGSATLPEGAAEDGGAAHHPAPAGQFRRSHIPNHQADAQVVTLMPDPELVFRPV